MQSCLTFDILNRLCSFIMKSIIIRYLIKNYFDIILILVNISVKLTGYFTWNYYNNMCHRHRFWIGCTITYNAICRTEFGRLSFISIR